MWRLEAAIESDILSFWSGKLYLNQGLARSFEKLCLRQPCCNSDEDGQKLVTKIEKGKSDGIKKTLENVYHRSQHWK